MCSCQLETSFKHKQTDPWNVWNACDQGLSGGRTQLEEARHVAVGPPRLRPHLDLLLEQFSLRCRIGRDLVGV